MLIFLAFAILSPTLPTKKILSTYVVTSGSMAPTVPAGAIVFVRPINPFDVKKNDIITFTSPNDATLTILHRVVDVSRERGQVIFETKGDNNDSKDSWLVPSFLVLGRAFFSVPFAGFAASFMKTPLGFAVLIGIPALALIISQVKMILAGFNEEINKRTEKELARLKEKE